MCLIPVESETSFSSSSILFDSDSRLNLVFSDSCGLISGCLAVLGDVPLSLALSFPGG